MALIPSEDSKDPESVGSPRPDSLQRVVQIALAVYLMPVIAVVCAIGGASLLFDQATRVAGRFHAKNPRSLTAKDFHAFRAGQPAIKPTIIPRPRQIRV